MPGFTQRDRSLKVFTCLPEDTLLLRGFQGREAISGLSSFTLDLISIETAVDPASMVGTAAGVAVRDLAGRLRWFDGYLRRFERGTTDPFGFTSYVAELVPWAWFLTRMADCRIFQGLTTLEIVEEVVSKAAAAVGLTFRLEAREPRRGKTPREYCVQYRETHYDFIARLLEDEGLSSFFVYDEGRHTLVISDTPTALPRCPHQSRAPYAPGVSEIPEREDIVTDLREAAEVRSGRLSHTDYNFLSPDVRLLVTLDNGGAPLELYDFPGGHGSVTEGDDLATVRLEERQSGRSTLSGASNIRHLTPGHRITLVGWPASQMGPSATAEVILLSVEHQASQTFHAPGDPGAGEDAAYSNTFTCQRLSEPLRPPRRTPRPIIYGTQTAVVQGPDGEEIWTDAYGRIKVRFHWDRDDRRGEERSCWIRVAQTWSGPAFGAFTLPRVGDEVVVSFLEGDPDRPLVIGSVYNAARGTPYELPEHQTRTTLKSNSSPGGGGFNEVRLEDKAGEEEVFLHAQKDFNEKVLNNHSRSVDANEVITVGGNRTVVIKGNQNLTIQGAPEKGGDEPVEGEAGNAFTGAATSVTGKYNVSASDTILITAPTSITLACGGSTVVLTPGAITLSAGDGSSVTLNADALMASSQGSIVKLDGDALSASSGGSVVKLTGDALMASSGGSGVKLTSDALMQASGGGAVKLTADAEMGGVNAKVSSAAATLALSPGDASLSGPLVKIN